MSIADEYATESPEARLRQLLVGAERDRLARLEARTDALSGRLGDDVALTESVARIIVGVLRDAGVRDHERLSMALAPLVLASLREEIRNSSDMMVDALYPITGRLVAAAVRNAFKELVETLNERVDQTVSIDRWKVRLEAWRTGKSEAEILLRRNPPFELEEVLLIHRPTGLPISRMERGEISGTDSDLVSGMLTAIMAFVRDALGKDEAREVRKISMDDSDLFISTSPAVILAVKARGTPPADFEGILESEFLSFLDTWGPKIREFGGHLESSEQQDLIADLRTRSQKLARPRGRKPRRSPWRIYVVFMAAAVAAIAWWVSASLEDRKILAIEAQGRKILREHAILSGYPLTVQYDRDQDVLVVEGLVPNAKVRDQVVSAFETRLSQVTGDFGLSILPDTAAALRQNLDTKLQEMSAQLSNVGERLTAMENTLDRQSVRIAALETIGPSPLDRLRLWAGTHAVSFSDGTTFSAPARARAALQELADLVGEAPASVRIRLVGYTDQTGGETGNDRLSLERARAVMNQLVALGVPEARLVPAGRGSEKMVSDSSGRDSPNRRVEFEMVLETAEPANGGQ